MKHYGFYVINPGLDTDVLQRFPTLRDMDTQSDGYPAGVYRYSLHGAYLEQNGALRTVKDIYYRTQTRLEPVIKSNIAHDFYYDTGGDTIIMSHKLENPIQFYDPRDKNPHKDIPTFLDEVGVVVTVPQGATIDRVFYNPYCGFYDDNRGARAWGIVGVRGQGLTSYTAYTYIALRGQILSNYTTADSRTYAARERLSAEGFFKQRDGSYLAYPAGADSDGHFGDSSDIYLLDDGSYFFFASVPKYGNGFYAYGTRQWGTDFRKPEGATIRTVVNEADRAALVAEMGGSGGSSGRSNGGNWLGSDYD